MACALSLLIFLALGGVTEALFACTKQDATCAALGDLYEATSGPGWLDRGGWEDAAAGIPTDYCTLGTGKAACDGSGHFRYLGIQQNNLTGTLPASLSSLTQLEIMCASHLCGGV